MALAPFETAPGAALETALETALGAALETAPEAVIETVPDDGPSAAAYDALSVVIDPELDEPITDLGFVRSLDVVGDRVTAHLRLPTSFCAPNFAYLMASDA
ncbi:MAG TPA: iron-sulfur cluster assembly protein, partial [Humibacillus sp.]|nr:iron-sulfur cluster assembly protein [Humibacillus sp.]